jgi:hypothetical protein
MMESFYEGSPEMGPGITLARSAILSLYARPRQDAHRSGVKLDPGGSSIFSIAAIILSVARAISLPHGPMGLPQWVHCPEHSCRKSMVFMETSFLSRPRILIRPS